MGSEEADAETENILRVPISGACESASRARTRIIVARNTFVSAGLNVVGMDWEPELGGQLQKIDLVN